jgi:hypothetical protein
MSQQISMMSLSSTVPPKFDCELFNDVSKAKAQEMRAKYLQEKEAMKGVQDSYIVFVRA